MSWILSLLNYTIFIKMGLDNIICISNFWDECMYVLDGWIHFEYFEGNLNKKIFSLNPCTNPKREFLFDA